MGPMALADLVLSTPLPVVLEDTMVAGWEEATLSPIQQAVGAEVPQMSLLKVDKHHSWQLVVLEGVDIMAGVWHPTVQMKIRNLDHRDRMAWRVPHLQSKMALVEGVAVATMVVLLGLITWVAMEVPVSGAALPTCTRQRLVQAPAAQPSPIPARCRWEADFRSWSSTVYAACKTGAKGRREWERSLMCVSRPSPL